MKLRLEELGRVAPPELCFKPRVRSLGEHRERARAWWGGEHAGAQGSRGHRARPQSSLRATITMPVRCCAMDPFLVDTHCHLDAQYFPNGPDGVLARAEAAGVQDFVVIGVGGDLGQARAAVSLAERRGRTFATVENPPSRRRRLDGGSPRGPCELGGATVRGRRRRDRPRLPLRPLAQRGTARRIREGSLLSLATSTTDRSSSTPVRPVRRPSPSSKPKGRVM